MLIITPSLYKKSEQGFTIVELLIVIVVIAILAAITIVSYNGINTRAKDASLKSDLHNAVSQLETDLTLNDTYYTDPALSNQGLAVDSAGAITVADSQNYRIKKITL